MTASFKGTFAEYVKIMRKRVNISSKELSKMLNKGDAYISQIENGRNKKPDYTIAYNLLKILKINEEKIEDILASFEILSPEKIKDLEEAEQAWVDKQEELAQDPDYQQALLESQIARYEQEMDWLSGVQRDLVRKNSDIQGEMAFFIETNLDTFRDVINNLHTLVMSISKNEEDYDFFTRLFKRDMTRFNKESKDKIISTIAEEFKKAHKYNGGWGEPPSF